MKLEKKREPASFLYLNSTVMTPTVSKAGFVSAISLLADRCSQQGDGEYLQKEE